MSTEQFNTGVIGASGYTGMELVRLLLAHPHVRLHCVSSERYKGEPLASCLPTLSGRTALRFIAHDDPAFEDCDVVFVAAPDAAAMHIAAALFQQGKRVIDLSANFRLRDVAVWEQWYGRRHERPELVAQAVYGLPERHREQLRTARLIANPGCYPTAVCLALLPLISAGRLAPDDIIVDAKSGVSGAGREAKPERLFCEVEGGFRAYAAGGHRHLPEMRQTLEEAAQGPVGLVFVPHLLPISRGIEATLYVRLRESSDAEALQALYSEHYRQEPFVEVMPAGAHPDVRHVRGTNTCRLAIHRPPGQERTVILSVLDNLLKGAAGQAVQNMNIACGLREEAGLAAVAMTP